MNRLRRLAKQASTITVAGTKNDRMEMSLGSSGEPYPNAAVPSIQMENCDVSDVAVAGAVDCIRYGRMRGPESSAAPSALTAMPTTVSATGRRQMKNAATAQNGRT